MVGIRVFLNGMMGCGKSTVGRALSTITNWPYIDNDALLAQREGLDLMSLAREGTDRLHAAEAELAVTLAEHPPPLIAGIPASVAEHDEICRQLHETGRFVYLRASPATLVARTTGGSRPFLADDPAEWIATTLAARAPAWARWAHLILDVDDVEPLLLAETIATAVGAT